MKEKPINRMSDNSKKIQKQQKYEINKLKNQNNIINRVSTNFSNDKNNISNNNIENKNILKDSLNQFQNDNINNEKNKIFEKIYNNLERNNNFDKVNRRIFNSRDKILKDNSLLNKVKSKNEFYSNNMKEKQKLYFNEKDEKTYSNNNQDKNNIKQIIYKKNNHLKNNLNTRNLKHKRGKEINNYIKIEELNEILSSDTEEMNNKSPKDRKIEYDNNLDNRNKLDEKEIISNNLTIKDEYNDYDSDIDTNRDKNILKSSMNFNNELALIPDKHLTQINFNKNNKNISEKKNSSHSPPPKQTIHYKKSQMMSLNLNTINQIKENPFQKNNNNINNNNNNINNPKELPVNSAKMYKMNKNKNIIKKSHHIMKEKKEIVLINYLKQNFFSKNYENDSNKINNIDKSKNDINNYEIKEEEKNKEKSNNIINNIKKRNNNGIILDNEELKLNLDIDFDNENKKNKIKYKEYKIKNNSLINGVVYLEQGNENININLTKRNDKLNQYQNLNDTLHKKDYNKGNNNSNDNNYISLVKNGNMGFIKKKSDKNNNKNGISLENDKNYEKKKPKNLYRNNSQNNDIKKKESVSSFDSNKKDGENTKNIYQLKINNLNLNNLNPSNNINNKINKEKKEKETNIKIASIEINNKLRKNIPSPQHRNKERGNIIKKTKVSPINSIINNNLKINSSNNLFNTANNTNSNMHSNINNNENLNNNIQMNNINDKDRIKSNSNNLVECLLNKNNNFAMTCKEKSINEFINKDNQNMNKLPSKKNIKCINKNINPQKYKNTYKIKQQKSTMNENSNTNNYCNPSTSTSNNNNSAINLEENYMSNNKSPKLSKNNINFNNSANKFIILNKNKRNINNYNNNNNSEEFVNNTSLNNYINSNSYSTADKNTFIHITNSNVTKMKNKMNSNTNNINNQKGINNQNYMIHPKNLFSSSNNNIKTKMNNPKNNINKKIDSISNNTSSNKLNNSNSNNNIYNDINKNLNNTTNNLSKNVNSDKKVNIYLYSNINNYNNDNTNKNFTENINSTKNSQIIKKSSTTMKNKSNTQNSNNNISNQNNRYSINGNQLSPASNHITDNIYNNKKLENKKLSNKVSIKAIKKNNNNYNINKGNKNNHNHNFNEDTFIDGQIPTVADENPNVNSLKIMKYNKCAYTNQIISQKLTKIFSIEKIKNAILSFSSKNDLNNLSLVNTYYSEKAISIIQKRIKYKILNNTETTIKILWNKILYNSKLYKNKNSFNENFIKYLNSSNKYDKEITKDLSRTLPNNIMFKKDPNNYKKLFNVLKAYSNYNKKIGYAQGMNFIVAKLIIFYNNEKDSFLNLDALFKRLNFSEVVGISNGLEHKMLVIQFLLQKFCPKIIDYLDQKKINHEIFTASWVITLFSKNFDDNKLLLMIWSFSIIFGWKFIYLFTISIIDNFQNKYLKLELYEFTQFMKQIFKSSDFKKDFNLIIDKTFDYMKHWKKINKELQNDIDSYRMKADTESGTELIIIDSFDEETIIQ